MRVRSQEFSPSRVNESIQNTIRRYEVPPREASHAVSLATGFLAGGPAGCPRSRGFRDLGGVDEPGAPHLRRKYNSGEDHRFSILGCPSSQAAGRLVTPVIGIEEFWHVRKIDVQPV
jgi:hypothetical protein